MRSDDRSWKLERGPEAEAGNESAIGFRMSRLSAACLKPFARSFTVPSLLLAGSLALAAAVLFWFDPSRYGIYPVCFLHRTTGLLCPGCGSLRALHHLLHGRMITAVHFNAFLVLGLPVLGAFALRALIRKARRQPPLPVVQPIWLWSAFVLLLLFGVARNLPFAHALWLAP